MPCLWADTSPELLTSLPLPPPPPPLQVTLTPLSSFGSSVPGFWSGQPALTGVKRDVECPATARAPIQAESNFKTVTNVGQKLEAVRRAVIKAFASHVYGLNEFGEYNNEIRVPDLDFKRGVLMVKRTDEYNVMYAVTEVRRRQQLRQRQQQQQWLQQHQCRQVHQQAA